ncbi:MAG: DUF58 domain-containing protein [Planctomycetes bacterium]|nr:DUF58 domain-containing protein [Planctomycetota bacterium]
MHLTIRSVAALAAGLPLALAPALIDAWLWPAWALIVAVTLALLLVDALRTLSPRAITVAAQVPTEIQIGEPAVLTVRIDVRGSRGARLRVLPELDAGLEPAVPASVDVAPPGGAVQFPLRARRRGSYAIPALWLEWDGPLGLVGRARRVPLAELRMAVVPDARAARAIAFRMRGAGFGHTPERVLGDGSEFDSLRAWVPGFDLRSVDWKASARHRRLLCRRFRVERNHQVVLAIDCGRTMSDPIDGVPRVDHAIRQALALAFLCLRIGDRVGLYAFDAEPRLYVEPQGGVRAFGRLRSRTAAIDYGVAESNYALGVLELTRRLRRRSLIVVFTEFADAVTAELLLDHLDRLARRHLVVFVAVRDPQLEARELGTPERLTDVHRAVVAAGLRREREVVFERLRRSGVDVIDAGPRDATDRLLERYLRAKRRELV